MRAQQDTRGVERQKTSWWRVALGSVLFSAYLATLWWIDRKNGAFSRLVDQWGILGLMLPMVLASHATRYARWFWLLGERGSAPPIWRGFFAYLAGFALTATPGKAGELLRIRYFENMGITPSRTIAAFVFERACDLLVILLLSLLAWRVFPTIGLLCLVVITLVGILFGLVAWPGSARCLEWMSAKQHGGLLKRLTSFIEETRVELKIYLRWRLLGASMAIGCLAWSLIALAFVGICNSLEIHAPFFALLGIYPLAMLIGALSFVPGGVGTTELAIVLMLERLGVPVPDALAAAIGVRLVTLWFAILEGSISVLALEYFPHKGAPLSTV